MPSSNCGLLLVLLALFQDRTVSSPIHHHQCNWDHIKVYTRNLNHLAMKFYNTTQANDNVVLDGIPKIQCAHRCGPKDLSLDKTTCLQNIYHVLSFYKSALDKLTDDKLEDYDKTKRDDILSIKQILTHLLHCLKDYKGQSTPTQNATSDFVKKMFGTPLASSSSLIARVFAAGDPSNHWLMKKK